LSISDCRSRSRNCTSPKGDAVLSGDIIGTGEVFAETALDSPGVGAGLFGSAARQTLVASANPTVIGIQ
jgi:hypothetical protein